MTYKEYKSHITSLGFEEADTIETEYEQIALDACNRSLQFLYDDIVLKLKWYYERELSTDDEKWTPKRPTIISPDSEDTTKLELPDNIIHLLPLLAGHFIWLDDDNVKATYYWNEYEDFRAKILSTCENSPKARITGGISW